MRFTLLAVPVVLVGLLGLAACGEDPPAEPAPPPPPDHAAEMVLRVEGPIASLDGIVDVLNDRLAALDAGTAVPEPGTPPRIRLLLDEPWQDDPDTIEGVATRAGSLELRIVATDEETRAEREIREQEGDTYRPSDPTYRWVPGALEGDPDVLVLAPELGPATEIRRLITEPGPQAKGETDRLRAELDSIRASEVFEERDLVAARAESMDDVETVVHFEIADDRKSSFGEFTGRYVGRQVAIVVDGRVEAAPVIRSALPGEGIIQGGGGFGFTDIEARALAVVLSAGRALPAKLVRESFERVR